jgi:hypothetical protein
MQGESIPWMESPQVLLVHCSLKKALHPIFTAHSEAPSERGHQPHSDPLIYRACYLAPLL